LIHWAKSDAVSTWASGASDLSFLASSVSQRSQSALVVGGISSAMQKR